MFYHTRSKKYINEGVAFTLEIDVEVPVPEVTEIDEESGETIVVTPASVMTELQEVQFPSNWLNHATPEDKAMMGLVEVTTEGERGDDRFFYVAEELDGPVRRWVNTPKSAEQVEAAQEQLFTQQLESYYDAKARERRYDTRYTCALRAGYAGPFQAEGLAFAKWMDACNAYGYQVMADVKSGTRELPTFEALLAEMPQLTWPK